MEKSRKFKLFIGGLLVVCMMIFASLYYRISNQNDTIVPVSLSVNDTIALIDENSDDTQDELCSDYSYQLVNDDEESKQMAEVCIEVLRKWNEGLNNQNLTALHEVYSGVVKYYLKILECNEIQKIQAKYFKNNPNRKQYVKDVRIAFINSCNAYVSFMKYSQKEPGGEIKAYPSYLEMECSFDNASIKAESDSLTDVNGSKLKQPELLHVTNEMGLDEIFCESNVGKRIKVDYWDLVDMNSEEQEEGPLAKAMTNAAGLYRIGISGSLKKNYKERTDTYYIEGYAHAGEDSWNLIWVYDANTHELTCE